MQIAFLGLGIMGSRMAANLLKAGHPLTVWNRSAEKAEALRPLGAQAAASPAEAVLGADVVFTMLSTPAAIEAVALGEGGFLPAMQSGALWVDCSTVDPDFSRRMAAEAAGRGLRFMDAPVAGSKAPAEAGKLRFLVGGKAEDLEQVRPLLEKMGSDIVHAGETGMGSALKLVNNLIMVQGLVAFCEGLVLGQALGLPRTLIFDALVGQAVVPGYIGGKRAKLENQEYSPEFPLRWAQKDLHLAAAAAFEAGVALPQTNIAKEIFRLADRAGLGEKDLTAVLAFLERDEE